MFEMVGYTLRQERERQNLSIEDIEQGTSIRALYIEAIENGEYEKLPGKVYTKGFIKNYAQFLELDVNAIVKEFAADMKEVEAVETPPVEEETEKAPEKPVEVKPVKNEKKPLGHSVEEDSGFSSKKLIIAAVVLIVALAGGAWSFLSSSDSNIAKVDSPVKQEQPVNPEQPPANNPESVASANPAPQSDVVNVQARFNDRCWALVTVDGAVVQEGIIDGGQTLTWEGKENVTFRLGNAGAVEFFQNGQSIGILGAEGDIVDKTFTRS